MHPQTVRYRIGQLRECFGTAWGDPKTVAALTVALVLSDPEPDDADD